MSITLSYVDQDLNPFAASFKVSADLMGKVGKIVFTADGTYKQYSPLAQRLLIKSVRRVDMSAENDGTLITVSRRLAPWDDRSLEGIASVIAESLGNEAAINDEEIANNITLRKPFHAAAGTIEEVVEQTFHEKVAPSLAEHGGAMELTNIIIGEDGQITMEIALMGSCQDCNGAETITVKAAEMHATEMLAWLKEQHPDVPKLQKMSIGKSKIQTVSDIAFERVLAL